MRCPPSLTVRVGGSRVKHYTFPVSRRLSPLRPGPSRTRALDLRCGDWEISDLFGRHDLAWNLSPRVQGAKVISQAGRGKPRGDMNKQTILPEVSNKGYSKKEERKGQSILILLDSLSCMPSNSKGMPFARL
jgi:hypothetical protein